jgi:hypothetical protein
MKLPQGSPLGWDVCPDPYGTMTNLIKDSAGRDKLVDWLNDKVDIKGFNLLYKAYRLKTFW